MDLKRENTESQPEGALKPAAIDPLVEDTYWRLNYKTRPYFKSGRPYADFQPAYRYGWESAVRYPGRKFEEVEEGARARLEPDGGPPALE